MNIKISVIIVTFNRPEKLLECVSCLLKSKLKDFEVIVVEQLGNGSLKNKVLKLDKRISYFNLKKRGTSRAKNYGILKARGDLIAFTDDDCVVDKNWLQKIYNDFKKQKGVTVLLGMVLPYQADQHKGLICPCTFLKTKARLIKKPEDHKRSIGFGNNMAFRKELYSTIGGFREWLGPGSVGGGAEDAEFFLRSLLRKHTIKYDPKVKVLHNRWLTPLEMKKQMLSYNRGEMACYGYYFFNKHIFAKKVLTKNFSNYLSDIKRNLRSYLSLEVNLGLFIDTWFLIIGGSVRVVGLCLAYFYSRQEPFSW